MWDWLVDTWNDIVDTASTTFAEDNLWSDVATEALTTAVVGAGIGALTSAITDGDISDGLLYGATGGLVVGGLTEFGSRFLDNWDMTSTTQMADTGVKLMGGEADLSGYMSQDQGGIFSTEFGDVSLSRAESPQAAGILTSIFGNKDTSKPSWWTGETTAAALKIGGEALKGAFGGESDQSKAVAEQARQFDINRADTEAAKAQARSALASYNVQEGSQAPGLSVQEQIRNRGLVGFSKEGAGVYV